MLALVTAGPLLAASGSPAPVDGAAVERFAREYLRLIDEGNLDGQMELVSRDPEVTSTIMGETWRGWEAIRAQSATYGPTAQVVRNAVRSVEVVPLGADLALALVHYRAERRDPAATQIPQFDNALSLVVKKTPQGWRMVHEHVSVRIPPTAIDFSKLE